MPDVIPGQTNSSKPRWLLILAIIFFILLVSATAGLITFDRQFKNKIYPNVFVGNFNLGGKSAEQARELINREVDKINQGGIIFSYKNKQSIVMPVIFSADGDLAYQIISFNTDQTVAAAMSYGKDGNFFIGLKNKFSSFTGKRQLPLAVLVNQEEIIKNLKNNFSDAYEPARDAGLAVKKIGANDYEFSVTEEKLGKIMDFEEAVSLLLTNLSKLNPVEIRLSTVTEYPKILARDCLNIETKARAIINLTSLTLKYGETKWAIGQNQLTRFLALKLTGPTADKVSVGLADKKFKDYLIQEVAPAINRQPLEAKFEIKNGRVSEFQNGQDGLALDVDSSFIKIEDEILADASAALSSPDAAGGKSPDAISGPVREIELVVKTTPALTNAGNINDLGIKEIVGVGTSNFAGSPVNRRHNIKVGGSAVNGLLIKPGEEFSLIKALGDISSSTGYLPELVIKENKTTPEFGGGLCQVGTTMFRAVTESGLPVTMRRNHSYRVQYYEPAGTDATIYDPWPDFRFINDMTTDILIQTKIASNTLSFEFWGTRDGRLVEKTKPTIYNIVKPNPPKIIETVNLKPGETKCTETAHNGADAYFDYQVTYPNGEIKKKRFSSHYVPWQKVCLLGVKELSAPPLTATSTPPISTN